MRVIGLKFRRLLGLIIPQALAWVGFFWLGSWISSYEGGSKTITVTSSGEVLVRYSHPEHFLEASGLLVAILFLAPVALTAIGLLEVWFGSPGSWARRFALLGLALVCLAWCGLAAIILGTPFLLLVIALLLTTLTVLGFNLNRRRPGEERLS